MALVGGVMYWRNMRATPFFLLDESSQETILQWRNSDGVRRWMDHTDPISLDDHLRFCGNLRHVEDRTYLRVDRDTTPIGVINLVDVVLDRGTASLGLYKSPETHGIGIGSDLMRMIHAVARFLRIDVLYLHVRHDNARAISLYRDFGYVEMRQEGDIVFMTKDLNQ